MFQHWKLKILAIILAILFWAFTVVTENASYTFPKETGGGIPIKAFNLSDNLALAKELGNVRVTVRTTSDVFQKLTPADFEAYVDFAGREAGTYMTDINVTPKKSDITVIKVEPAQIETLLEELTNKTVSIVPEIRGHPASNYEINELTLDITSAKIFGPESVLADINEVKAIIELSGNEKSDVERNYTLKVMDATGEELDTIRLEQSEVNGLVAIQEILDSKTVGIKANVVDDAGVYWIKKLTVEPATVLIKGEAEDLKKIDFIETEPVYAANAQGEMQKQVRLSLPQGIFLVEDKNTSVRVTLQVEAYKSTKEIFASIRYKSKKGDIEVEPSSIRVTLEGPDSILDSIKSSDVYATVNMRNVKSGDTIELTSSMFTVPEGVTLAQFEPKKLKVVE